MDEIKNTQTYLDRMSKPLQEKLKVARFVPKNAKRVLDVGCADGTITLALAEMFPQIQFVGLDLSQEFVDIANSKVGDLKNISFECSFLRDRLNKPEKFDVILFCSVLHEFFSYGEGISTVVKALSDAKELLADSGVVIIRDMVLYDYMKSSDLWLTEVYKKVVSKTEIGTELSSFQEKYGQIKNLRDLNHFLLKYMYADGWTREIKENYTAVSFEDYRNIFDLLNMKVLFQRSSTIPYLKEKWKNDFGLTDTEVENFRSTGIIVAQKN